MTSANLPAAMRAITISRYGGPEVIQHRSDVPVPHVGSEDVLVRVACAGVNFMDIHTRQGKYAHSMSYPVRLPCTLGMEGAGTVVARGANVDRLALGDRVAWCIAWGSYAEYARVPAFLAARIPDEIGFDVAAASMFQGCTAHYLVNDVARIAQGTTCLVHAASGSIGQILVQMAKRRGGIVFATASSPDKREKARQRGADNAIAYEGFAEAVRAGNGGQGVEVAFDSLGKATLRETFKAVRPRGLVVNYGNVSGSIDDLDPIELGEAGSLFLTRPRLADHMRDAATVQRRADDVFGAILARELHIDIAERYSLEEVEIGHERIESRQQVGKALVEIG
jgi:NADPH:quinone reductase-like Zn-dependent oxidoreductase